MGDVCCGRADKELCAFLPQHPHLHHTARVPPLLHQTKGYSSVKWFSAITLCSTFSLLLKMCLFLCVLLAQGWVFSTASLGTQDGEGPLGSLLSVGMVGRDLQQGSDSCDVVECVEKNLDRQKKLLSCGLEAGFGVRSGQSDPWVAVETQMFQKRTRPLHVVCVTPAARASTSRFHVSCRELPSSRTPPPLFQGNKGCMHTKQRREDWSCVCELRQASNTSHHSLGRV